MASSRSLLFSFAKRETSDWRELKNARSSTFRSGVWAGWTTTSMEKPFILPCEAKTLSIDTCRVWASPIVLVRQSRAGFWTLGTLVVTESPLATDNFSARNTHTSHGLVSGRRVEPPHHFTHFLENTAFGHDFRTVLRSINCDILQDYGLTSSSPVPVLMLFLFAGRSQVKLQRPTLPSNP